MIGAGNASSIGRLAPAFGVRSALPTLAWHRRSTAGKFDHLSPTRGSIPAPSAIFIGVSGSCLWKGQACAEIAPTG